MGRTIAWKLSLVLMLGGACTSANREHEAKHGEDAGGDAGSPESHSDDEESQPSDKHDDEQAEVDASVPEDVPEDAGTPPEKDSNVAPKTDAPSPHIDETHKDEPALPRTEEPPPVHEPALEPLPPLPHPREGVCAFLPPADPAFHVDNVNCPDGIYPGNVSLQSDADVEKLRGCTRVHGNVEVYADNVSSLAALDALQVIDGALFVSTVMQCNAESSACSFPSAPLASLAGLDGLRCLGDALSVISGSRKIAVDALHNVVEIGGKVTLSGIKESSDTFRSLRRVWGDLDAASNSGLFTLPRLEAVYGHYYRGLNDGSISVGCSDPGNYCRDGVLGCSLVAKTESELAQLSNCEIVRGPLYISGAALENLSALKNLRHVSAGLYLYGNGNSNVTSLAGLESLQSVGGLYVANLPSLTSLEAMKNTSFQHLLGTDIGQAHPEAVSGEVELTGLPKLESLNGLGSVPRLQNLTINDCDALTDLSGLSALKDVGVLRLEGNAGLLSLNGLLQLRTAFSIELISDPNVVDISALSVLASATNLRVYNLLYLTDFLPLRTVHLGSVTLLNMPSLRSLDGLEGLGETANVINIQNNPVLEDITALSGVHTVWRIEIRGNNGLRSLAGLEGLESVSESSEIFNNPLVPQCAVDALHQRIPLLEGTSNDTTATCQ